FAARTRLPPRRAALFSLGFRRRRNGSESPRPSAGGERMRRVVTASLCLTLSVTGHTSLNGRDRIARLSLDEAMSLALLENPTVHAKELERRATATNEIMAGLRPNPLVTFLAVPHPAGSVAIHQLEAAVGGPLEN